MYFIQVTALKILITGITSIHGWPVYRTFCTDDKFDIFGIRPPKMSIPEGPGSVPLCITDSEGLREIRQQFRPDIVIHCAGVCDLDVCEERPEWADSLNRGGARSIREVFGESCQIIYLSSDLVFSGNNPPEGGYTEENLPDPVSVVVKLSWKRRGR